MALRREQIAMTPEEVAAFLDSQLLGVVGTNGPTGRPHLATLGFAREGEAILLTSYAASQKVKNLERDPSISLLVEVNSPYAEVRGVLAYGTATIVSDPERTAAVATSILDRARDGGETQQIPQQQVAPKRRLLVVTVDRWISWDHRKLDGTY